MKKVLSVMILLACVLNVNATIQVSYTSGIGTLTDNLGAPLASDRLMIAYLSISDTLNNGFNNINPLSPLADDIVIGVHETDANFSLGGRLYGDYLYESETNPYGTYVADYFPGKPGLYVAVFEQAYSATPSFTPGEYYGLGPVYAPAGGMAHSGVGSPPPLPDDYGAEVNTAGGIQTSLQLAPEPNTMLLALLGVIGVVFFRIRKK